MKALVFNIQRYCIHDGPGIRTTVFFKGCPLHCLWCSNPESQKYENECMQGAKVADLLTPEEVCVKALRDKPFYKRSGGGITYSGGEPLSVAPFLSRLTEIAHQNEVNVAIETTGYQKWEQAWLALKDIDYILYDVKHMDSNKHKSFTGVDNELILENLDKLIKKGKRPRIRIPVIPTFNNSYQQLDAIMNHLSQYSQKIEGVDLLPYHKLGVHKYAKLKRDYLLKDDSLVDQIVLKEMVDKLRTEYPFKISIY